MKEIVSSSNKELQNAWPDVIYKGQAFFDIFYNALNVWEEVNFQIKNFSYQECYVGYLSSTDEFIVGWDIWHKDEDSGFAGKVICFKFDGESLSTKNSYGEEYGRIYHDAYKDLHEKFSDLKDLRLD